MKHSLAKLGAASIIAFGLTYQAQVSAAPIFTVDPTALGWTSGSTFDADRILGGSQTLITLNSATKTATGSGWIRFDAFENSNVPSAINNSISGLNFSATLNGTTYEGYELWAEFDYSLSLLSGNFGQNGSKYTMTSINFDVFGRNGIGNTYTAATTAGGIPTVVTPGLPAELLGFGSLVAGTTELTSLGGAAFNAITTFTTTALGDSYFVAPQPFYTLAFENFNNTTQGVTRNGDYIAIAANGSIDFNGIPEPATLALLSIGLIGVGAATRQRQA